MTPGTYTARQVAERLGISSGAFSLGRARLEAAGFPLPLVETRYVRRGGTAVRRGLWSRRQVDAWIDGLAAPDAAVVSLRRSFAASGSAGIPGGDPELAARATRLAGIA